MKWVDYREKLGIGLNDKSRVKRVMNSIMIRLEYKKNQFSNEELIRFFMMTGEQANCFSTDNGEVVRHLLSAKQNDFREFLSCYTAMMNCESADSMKVFYRTLLTEQLDQFGIAYEVICDQDGLFVLPKGAPELDNALVSASLEWLSEYPDARKLFVKALIMQNDATEDNASNVVDAFRKALECFFQLFFSSDGKKSLENYMPAYSEYLKSHDVAQEIANNLAVLLKQYTIYDNNFAKHQDRANTRILEYWMYQTFNVVRLLITLKKEDDSQQS